MKELERIDEALNDPGIWGVGQRMWELFLTEIHISMGIYGLHYDQCYFVSVRPSVFWDWTESTTIYLKTLSIDDAEMRRGWSRKKDIKVNTQKILLEQEIIAITWGVLSQEGLLFWVFIPPWYFCLCCFSNSCFCLKCLAIRWLLNCWVTPLPQGAPSIGGSCQCTLFRQPAA